MVFGDSLFNEYGSSTIQGSCAKMPRWFLEGKSVIAYVHINLYGTVMVTLVFVPLVLHLAIFLKQRQIGRQLSVPDYSITYNTGDVKITRDQESETKLSSSRILCRFRRNVISPLGSFSSFLASAIYYLLMTYILLSITKSGPSVLGEILLFFVHIFLVFCLNLIESICSPTLRNSLINVMPWSKDEYCVASIDAVMN